MRSQGLFIVEESKLCFLLDKLKELLERGVLYIDLNRDLFQILGYFVDLGSAFVGEE